MNLISPSGSYTACEAILCGLSFSNIKCICGLLPLSSELAVCEGAGLIIVLFRAVTNIYLLFFRLNEVFVVSLAFCYCSDLFLFCCSRVYVIGSCFVVRVCVCVCV